MLPSSVFLRVNIRSLLIVLVLTLPLLLIDMVVVLDRSRAELTSFSGEHLQTLAETAAADVFRFVEACVKDARLLAADGELRATARRANEIYRGRDPEQVRQQYEDIDRDWESPRAAPIVSKLMGSRPSVALREYLELNPSVTRILVTDQAGASIAATHKPVFYYHGDQAWWIDSFGDSQSGAVYVSNPYLDPVSRISCIAISAPMLEAGENRVIGVVRIFISAEEITDVVANAEPGRTGKALVSKRDGTVVSTNNARPERSTEVEEMETIRRLLTQRASGYSTVPLRGGGKRIVGFADTGLARLHTDIDWVALITQEWEEASAPIDSIHFRALMSGILAILIVGVIAVFFTTHRPSPLDPLDHLRNSPKADLHSSQGKAVT